MPINTKQIDYNHIIQTVTKNNLEEYKSQLDHAQSNLKMLNQNTKLYIEIIANLKYIQGVHQLSNLYNNVIEQTIQIYQNIGFNFEINKMIEKETNSLPNHIRDWFIDQTQIEFKNQYPFNYQSTLTNEQVINGINIAYQSNKLLDLPLHYLISYNSFNQSIHISSYLDKSEIIHQLKKLKYDRPKGFSETNYRSFSSYLILLLKLQVGIKHALHRLKKWHQQTVENHKSIEVKVEINRRKEDIYWQKALVKAMEARTLQ